MMNAIGIALAGAVLGIFLGFFISVVSLGEPRESGENLVRIEVGIMLTSMITWGAGVAAFAVLVLAR